MSTADQDREHRAATIARLNDRLRLTPSPGWMITSGVMAQGPVFIRQAVLGVGTFNDFPAGNDLYGERDFRGLHTQPRPPVLESRLLRSAALERVAGSGW